ncbi:GNAT family N-acetyltransferase [Streptomyces chiangmaiensis]|uniref:GNAT family N-acetyltransferase n=1 Tax=Streptomyces chiangmaiensis TaxID=766497 RepID=A0ABU7FBM6_9ACTN|nr:GNAT family N-acetyltransferase [Streptomyces chiangmaiensis]MED7821582.1 GNAT family N-acetyltransferase [Streptomyces chiangmaiensis]
MTHMNDPLRPVADAYVAAFEGLSTAAGHTRRGPHGAVLAISGAPVAALNAIISPSPDPNPDEIAALAASEAPWELPWSIHVRGTPGPLVTEVAARNGLTRFSTEPLMIRRPDQGMPPQSAVGSLRVRPVSSDELDLYARTVAEGFEAPHETFQVFSNPSLAKVDGVTFYLAEVDGVPVGTGMTAVSEDLLGLFNISTLPHHRRRGYGRAVTTELLRAGHAAGATTSYLYASKMGEPVYESVGFRTEEYMTVITAP